MRIMTMVQQGTTLYYFKPRRAKTKTKFMVLLALLTILLSWWKARATSYSRYPYVTFLGAEENRSSAFTIRRGSSTEAAAAARLVASGAPAAKEAIARAAARVVPGLGEQGRPSRLLQEHEDREAMRIMKIEAFNKLLSDHVSLNRSLPDVRHPLCRHEWDMDLPKASVVVVFHNEPRSTLLRTVHSVVARSPPQLLREVILVDDASDREELQFELDFYLDNQFHGLVRRVKLPRRWGIVRARIIGAYAAKAPVIVFLDAHCEVTEQWLEPLVAHVRDNRRSVAVPIIDIINARTLEYEPRDSEDFKIGGFNWDGHYRWDSVSEREKHRRGTPANPTMTPVMAGGLFAINREYFWEIGAYDEQMDLWGGENLEMSFRVWMCGGSIYVIPCSRVGHIFRDFSPYTLLKDSHGINTARLAHVWMDDYKRIFFFNRPDLKDIEIGDLTSRIQLRQKLKCQNFQWYLQNIFPTKFITDENVLAYGKVRPRAVGSSLCLERLQRTSWDNNSKEFQISTKDFVLGMGRCYAQTETQTSQIFALSLKGELRWEESCAEYSNTSGVVFEKCRYPEPAEYQQWEYSDDLHLRHKVSGLCLQVQELVQGSVVALNPCIENNLKQIWTFENFFYYHKKQSLVPNRLQY